MEHDDLMRNLDRVALDLEARRLRAAALATGVRSFRNWTARAFQLRSAKRSV